MTAMNNRAVMDDEEIDLSGGVTEAVEAERLRARKAEIDDRRNSVDLVACRKMIEGLSDDQSEVALSNAQNILLIGPPGTGKTRTIVGRIAAALEAGIRPEEILVCTYTNAAAKELIERIQPLVKVSIKDLWIGTIHSIGLRIMRADAEALGLGINHAIIDEAQQRQVVRQKMIDLRHPAADGPDFNTVIVRILRFIQEAKNRMMGPSDAEDAYGTRKMDWAVGISKAEIEIYRAYVAYTKMYDLVDYSDMLFIPTQMIENSPKFSAIWQNRFKLVIVDEYQDVAASQVRMIVNLVGADAKFFAAADDDQCIYSWRGSDLKNVLDFKNYWTKPEILTLKLNHRTPRNIFRIAAELIRHNPHRYAKSIQTHKDDKAVVRAVECANPQDEKQRILDNIVDAHQAMGIPLEKMAIICRVNRQCQEFATFLSSNGIPANLDEPLPLHASPVAGLLAWMQASQGIDNPLIFDKMVTYPERLFAEGKLNEIAQRVSSRNELTPQARSGPVKYIKDLRDLGKVPADSSAAIFLDRLKKVADIIDANPTSPFASVAEGLGITDLVRASTEDASFSPFIHLLDSLADEGMSVKDILASLTSLDMNAGRAGIRIMTMHGAKGLEFEAVFSPGWEEGEFPSRMRTDEESIEEERRLAYVTITRARKMFMVTWSGNRKGHVRPSPFIAEMKLVD